MTPVRVGPMHSASHSEAEERIEDRVRDEAAARGLERLERSVLDIPKRFSEMTGPSVSSTGQHTYDCPGRVAYAA